VAAVVASVLAGEILDMVDTIDLALLGMEMPPVPYSMDILEMIDLGSIPMIDLECSLLACLLGLAHFDLLGSNWKGFVFLLS